MEEEKTIHDLNIISLILLLILNLVISQHNYIDQWICWCEDIGNIGVFLQKTNDWSTKSRVFLAICGRDLHESYSRMDVPDKPGTPTYM
jgi:hypothetical protein